MHRNHHEEGDNTRDREDRSDPSGQMEAPGQQPGRDGEQDGGDHVASTK